jgi:hypothetical protein
LRNFESTTGGAEADSLLPLFVPVPQGLGEVLGYRGNARFLGMFWSEDANEIVLDDGIRHGVGESLRFLEYCGHRAVEGELGDLNFGLLDGPATVWLVLDRPVGNLYYASAEVAREFLARQHVSGTTDPGGVQLANDGDDAPEEADPLIAQLRADLNRFFESKAGE